MYSPYDAYPAVAIGEQVNEPHLETSPLPPPTPPLARVRPERKIFSLTKSQSNSAFGDVFAIKNKAASQKFKKTCMVTVYDYGKNRYQINGKEVSQDGRVEERAFSQENRFSNPEELLAGLPILGLEKPDWATVSATHDNTRAAKQFLLRIADSERQYTFNNIVDTKQRVMGLLLDGTEEDASKFLLVTKVANLKREASELMKNENAELYNVDNFLELEQISYLLKNDRHDPDDKLCPGTLISFQEGKEGDVFGDLRARLRENSGKERRRGAPYLLMQLVRASCESACDIEHYIEEALEQLEAKMKLQPGVIEFNNKARQIDAMCEELRRVMLPFAQTLEWMTGSKFPKELLGGSPVPWVDLHMQQHRLNDNIQAVICESQGSQTLARSLVEGYRDIQAKKSERTALAMSMILAVFSPLSFVSGIYGMNFTGGTMPELDWTRDNSVITGYEYFWILVGVLVVCTILIYMCAGLIPGPISLFRTLTNRN